MVMVDVGLKMMGRNSQGTAESATVDKGLLQVENNGQMVSVFSNATLNANDTVVSGIFANKHSVIAMLFRWGGRTSLNFKIEIIYVTDSGSEFSTETVITRNDSLSSEWTRAEIAPKFPKFKVKVTNYHTSPREISLNLWERPGVISIAEDNYSTMQEVIRMKNNQGDFMNTVDVPRGAYGCVVILRAKETSSSNPARWRIGLDVYDKEMDIRLSRYSLGGNFPSGPALNLSETNVVHGYFCPEAEIVQRAYDNKNDFAYKSLCTFIPWRLVAGQKIQLRNIISDNPADLHVQIEWLK